jgi:hypothetical protein
MMPFEWPHALSESVGRWVAVEAYARMLSGDAQFRVVLTV